MTVSRSCPQHTRITILEIFHKLAMTPEGSEAIFKSHFHSNDLDQKPESYLFITMLVIDIRSTIPSLQEKLHSDDYLATSERLGKAYDIVSAFVGFLIQSLDLMSIDDNISNHPASVGPMPVDLLLKLRTNISETMSLTVEYLRDRYDSSTAGAAGLHPAARSSIDRSSPLAIAWDTSNGMFADPLTLSQLRTLSLWLRDEENDALRREAAGVMDALLALYQHRGEQDFRYPVLVALEVCLSGHFLSSLAPRFDKNLVTSRKRLLPDQIVVTSRLQSEDGNADPKTLLRGSPSVLKESKRSSKREAGLH